MKQPIIGATFYKVHTLNQRNPSFSTVRVTKVGRTWATFETVGKEQWRHMGGRFDKITGRLHDEGFTSPGRVYDDEQHYQRISRAKKLWEELRRKVSDSYRVPDHLDEVGVLKIADALGFKLKGE